MVGSDTVLGGDGQEATPSSAATIGSDTHGPRPECAQPLGGEESGASFLLLSLRERWRHHPQQPREGTDTIPSSHERNRHHPQQRRVGTDTVLGGDRVRPASGRRGVRRLLPTPLPQGEVATPSSAATERVSTSIAKRVFDTQETRVDIPRV